MKNFYTDTIMTDPRFSSTQRVADPALLEPVTRALVTAIIMDAAANGLKLMIFETFRSQARQAALFDQGATQLKQAGVHHYGLACDLVKDINGEPSWKGDFLLLGELAHHHRMIWGGDWGNPAIQRGFVDDDHVQRCTVGRQAELFAGTWYPDDTYDPYEDRAVRLSPALPATARESLLARGMTPLATGFTLLDSTLTSSNGELLSDLAEATKYLTAIRAAADACKVDPALICAVGSRESNWGQGSDMRPKGPAGTGDWAPRNPATWHYRLPPDGLGWGRGLMQIDYAESDFGKTGNWQDPASNVLFGTEELADNIRFFKAHPSPNVDPMAAAVAAYNCGQGGVKRAIAQGKNVDTYTTGQDYSSDVLRRFSFFTSRGFGQN